MRTQTPIPLHLSVKRLQYRRRHYSALSQAQQNAIRSKMIWPNTTTCYISKMPFILRHIGCVWWSVLCTIRKHRHIHTHTHSRAHLPIRKQNPTWRQHARHNTAPTQRHNSTIASALAVVCVPLMMMLNNDLFGIRCSDVSYFGCFCLV